MALKPPTFLSTDNAAPGVSCFAVTPSDTVNFTKIPRAFYVGTTGDVVLVNTDGTTVTWTAVPAGMIIPCTAIRVNSTSTTASTIVGIL